MNDKMIKKLEQVLAYLSAGSYTPGRGGTRERGIHAFLLAVEKSRPLPIAIPAFARSVNARASLIFASAKTRSGSLEK